MRNVKRVGALMGVLALTALALAATASAEVHLWAWLPGAAGTHFSGKSGKATLQEKGGTNTAITCKESKITEKESELTSPATAATLGKAVLEFSGCKAFGVAVESLGNASGIIIANLKLHNCLIAGGSTHGVIIEPEPLHIDVPATGLLVNVGGSFVAEVKAATNPSLTWELVVEQKEGKQAISSCEGGSALSLTSNTDNGGTNLAGQEAKEGSITFSSETKEEAMS